MAAYDVPNNQPPAIVRQATDKKEEAAVTHQNKQDREKRSRDIEQATRSKGEPTTSGE